VKGECQHRSDETMIYSCGGQENVPDEPCLAFCAVSSEVPVARPFGMLLFRHELNMSTVRPDREPVE